MATTRLFKQWRSAHDALKQASEYVESGRYWVVDLDLEKYFDTVNHDRLMHRLSRERVEIGDVVEGLVAEITQSDHQSGAAQCLV